MKNVRESTLTAFHLFLVWVGPSCMFVTVKEQTKPGPVVFTGSETMEYAWAMDEPGVVDCELHWQVNGRRSGVPCAHCEWVLDMELNYDPYGSWDSGLCEEVGLTTDLKWTYALDTTDESLPEILIWDDRDEQWLPWLRDSLGTDSVQFETIDREGPNGEPVDIEDPGRLLYWGGWRDQNVETGKDSIHGRTGNYYTLFWMGDGSFDL